MYKPDLFYFERAAQAATKASCSRAKCGAVIVDTLGDIIGTGFNAPPLGLESQRMCEMVLDKNVKQNNDKTCCVHAEWNAILNATNHGLKALQNSRLYFMRVDDEGNFTEAGDPYCTVCSRLALQSGVASFYLWNNGPELWETQEYNLKSYNFFTPKQ